MELIIKEGRVYGSRYYTVHPVIQPVWDQNPKDWTDIIEWSVDTFGPTPKDGVWTPNARWYVNNAKFWFRDPKDLEWFILKWE